MTLRNRSIVWAGMFFGAGILAALVGALVAGGSGGTTATPGLAGPAARPRKSFGSFRGAILGTTKTMIADVLGPPPTATRGQANDALTSEIWYYPLDVREQSAMAIRFGGTEQRAVAVEKIFAPR